MSGLDTQTHKHTHTQSDYRNPRCACAPRVNNCQCSSDNEHNSYYSSNDGCSVVTLTTTSNTLFLGNIRGCNKVLLNTVFINPRRACAARVTLCVSTDSVTALAATAFVSACNDRHLRHYYRLFLDLSSWIFEKTFRSKVMA